MKIPENGILLVDKPAGWTSFDVVAKVRNILKQQLNQNITLGATHEDEMQGADEKRKEQYKRYGDRVSKPATKQFASSQTGIAGSASKQGLTLRSPKVKVGHTGTLDPFATGLLIIVTGTFTKKVQELSKLDKTYEVTMTLGKTSTTGDPEGIVADYDLQMADKRRMPTKERIEEVLKSFKGTMMQTPPSFSAIKINGRRAYDFARKGQEVVIQPRKVTIHSIKLTRYRYPEVKFSTNVSSGTYIRSLVADIGDKLDTGAYTTQLRRTEVGEFSVSDENLFKIEGM